MTVILGHTMQQFTVTVLLILGRQSAAGVEALAD